MASKPLDTYIKTPPPSNPASKETYLEQQLGSIEKVLQKHTTTIEENYENNVASITEEQGVRATADSALSYSLQQLSATVEVNNASTQGQITNLQTAAADASTATATQLQTLTAKVDTNLGSTNAAISNEQKARATADSALASKISTLTAQAEFSDSKLQASITSETSARVTAISAEATSRQALQATVTNNFNTLNSAITTEATTRATADTTNANSITSLTSTVNGQSANITTLTSTTASITGALSAQWAVQGTIDGVTGGLRLTGLKKSDGTGAVYNLIIDANTRINGDLLVTGTVAAARLATIPGSKLETSGSDLITAPNIISNAVSDNQANVVLSGNTATVGPFTLAVGDRMTIIGYGGGGIASNNGGSGTLQIFYSSPTYPSGISLGSALTMKAFCDSVTAAYGYTSTTGTFVSVIGSAYSLPPATILQAFTATTAGTHYFSNISGLGGATAIAVIRLSR